jgi:hypothetical protein
MISVYVPYCMLTLLLFTFDIAMPNVLEHHIWLYNKGIVTMVYDLDAFNDDSLCMRRWWLGRTCAEVSSFHSSRNLALISYRYP